MPLLNGNSREVIAENIAELRRNGHAEDHAIAIALHKSRDGSEPGYTDTPTVADTKKKKQPAESDAERYLREQHEKDAARDAAPKPNPADATPHPTTDITTAAKPPVDPTPAEDAAPSLAGASANAAASREKRDVKLLPMGPVGSAGGEKVEKSGVYEDGGKYLDRKSKKQVYRHKDGEFYPDPE